MQYMQYNTRAIQNNKGFLIKCSTRIKILEEMKIMKYNINATKKSYVSVFAMSVHTVTSVLMM